MAAGVCPGALPSGHPGRDIPASVIITAGVPGDVNHDGTVDILDLVLVAGCFGASTGDPGFDAAADITGDEQINVLDLATVGLNFGRSYQP